MQPFNQSASWRSPTISTKCPARSAISPLNYRCRESIATTKNSCLSEISSTTKSGQNAKSLSDPSLSIFHGVIYAVRHGLFSGRFSPTMLSTNCAVPDVRHTCCETQRYEALRASLRVLTLEYEVSFLLSLRPCRSFSRNSGRSVPISTPKVAFLGSATAN